MTALSPVVSRLLALALLAAVALGAWLGIVEPVKLRFAEHDRTIEQSRDLLNRHIGIAHERQQLEAQLATLRETQSTTGRLIEGDSVELATAGMQNKLKALTRANDAELKSTQILPAQDGETFRKVTVRVTMMADTEAAQAVFHALETATPYLFLDRLDLRGPKRRSRRKNKKDQGILQVRFDIFGYMRIDGS
jgi:general secretion pathway protein M